MFLSGVRQLVAQMSLKGRITENNEVENTSIHSFQMMPELLGDTHLEAKFDYGPFPSSLPLNVFEFKLVQLQDRCCAIGRHNLYSCQKGEEYGTNMGSHLSSPWLTGQIPPVSGV